MIDHPEDYAGPTEMCGRCHCLVQCGDYYAANGLPKPDGFTGAPPGMLQDDSRGLSQWLASKPDARRHAREAAQAIRRLPNCAVECEALCQMSVRGYCERPRRHPGGWSDSGPQVGA
jgi:hypothetical protein